MTESVAELLADLKSQNPEDFVFPGRGGVKIIEISKSFSRAIKRLGFNEGITDRRQKVCFHTLRHTFASWLAQAGEPLLTIKELLGHKTMSMTERYSHLSPDHRREAVARIQAISEK